MELTAQSVACRARPSGGASFSEYSASRLRSAESQWPSSGDSHLPVLIVLPKESIRNCPPPRLDSTPTASGISPALRAWPVSTADQSAPDQTLRLPAQVAAGPCSASRPVSSDKPRLRLYAGSPLASVVVVCLLRMREPRAAGPPPPGRTLVPRACASRHLYEKSSDWAEHFGNHPRELLAPWLPSLFMGPAPGGTRFSAPEF